MAGNEISKYFISIGVKVDDKEIRKIDSLMKRIEGNFSGVNGAGKGGLNFKRFSVDQRALERVLGNALDVASRRVSFNIERFNINESSLRASLMAAYSRASMSLPLQSRAARESHGSSRARSAGIGAGAYALASRAFLPVAALAAGGYGLSSLNQRNQQVVAAQLQTQAVVQQAGGTAQQGEQAFNWLRSQANRVGFNYLDAVGDFSKLTSGLTGAGMSVRQAQGVYRGFAELARTNKLDRVSQQRVFRALSQVAGKGKLQSEELVGQLAESLPGAVALFAQAYQRQTGGKLEGQASIAALQKAMKAGNVNSGILTFAGDLASERAAPALASASQASQAQQARFQNQLNDLSVLASKSGVEEGFARIFRTLNDGLSEAGPLVERLSSGFNEATKYFRILSLIPQSFNRMLEGKSSFITNLIGEDQAKEFRTSIKEIQDAWGELKASLGDTDWAQYLKTTLTEINAVLQAIVSTINGSKWLSDEVSFGLNGPNEGTSADRLKRAIAGDDDRINIISQRQTDAYNRGDTDAEAKYTAQLDALQGERDKWQGWLDKSQGNASSPWAMGLGGSTTQQQVVNVNIDGVQVSSGAQSAQDVGTIAGNAVTDAINNHLIETTLNFPKVGR